jgi:hypothetical protein
MEKSVVNEIGEHSLARGRVDMPEAACLGEGEPKTGHFAVFAANAGEKLLVRGHDGTFLQLLTVLSRSALLGWDSKSISHPASSKRAASPTNRRGAPSSSLFLDEILVPGAHTNRPRPVDSHGHEHGEGLAL